MITTTSGLPMEIIITPVSIADITALKAMEIDIVPSLTLYGDKAYTDYAFEDVLGEAMNIRLVPQQKACMKRQHYGPLSYQQGIRRKCIETTFGLGDRSNPGLKPIGKTKSYIFRSHS